MEHIEGEIPTSLQNKILPNNQLGLYQIFQKPRGQQVLDEMIKVSHISEKSPKFTTEFIWYYESVHEVGAHLGTGKLGFDKVSKNGHNGMVMAYLFFTLHLGVILLDMCVYGPCGQCDQVSWPKDLSRYRFDWRFQKGMKIALQRK